MRNLIGFGNVRQRNTADPSKVVVHCVSCVRPAGIIDPRGIEDEGEFGESLRRFRISTRICAGL